MPKNNLDTLMIRVLYKMSGASLEGLVLRTDPTRELFLNLVHVKNETNDASIAIVGVDRSSHVHVLGYISLATKALWYKLDIKQWLPAGEKIKLVITGGNADDLIEIHITGHYR